MNICDLGINYIRQHLNCQIKNTLNPFGELVENIKELPLNAFLNFREELKTYKTLELKHTFLLYRGLKKQDALSLAQKSSCEEISNIASIIICERKNLANQAFYLGLKMSRNSWSRETVKLLVTKLKDLDEKERELLSGIWKGLRYWINEKCLCKLGIREKEDIKAYCKLMGEELKSLTMDISHINETDMSEIINGLLNLKNLKSLKLSDSTILNKNFSTIMNHPTLDTLILKKHWIKENVYKEIKAKGPSKLVLGIMSERKLAILGCCKGLKELTLLPKPILHLTKQEFSSIELAKETLEAIDIHESIILCSVEELIEFFEKFPRLKRVRMRSHIWDQDVKVNPMTALITRFKEITFEIKERYALERI